MPYKCMQYKQSKKIHTNAHTHERTYIRTCIICMFGLVSFTSLPPLNENNVSVCGGGYYENLT